MKTEMTEAEVYADLDRIVAGVEKVLRFSKEPMTVEQIAHGFKLVTGQKIDAGEVEYALGYLEMWDGLKPRTVKVWGYE